MDNQVRYWVIIALLATVVIVLAGVVIGEEVGTGLGIAITSEPRPTCPPPTERIQMPGC